MDQMSPVQSHELPKPQQNNVISDSGEYVVSAPETHNFEPTSGERVSQAASAVALAADDSAQASASQMSVVDNNAQKTSVTSFVVPLAAADADRIEKEWVSIAKFIVKSTRLDPRSQATELSSFKHEYIKKRYGKEVKLSENKAA